MIFAVKNKTCLLMLTRLTFLLFFDDLPLPISDRFKFELVREGSASFLETLDDSVPSTSRFPSLDPSSRSFSCFLNFSPKVEFFITFLT